MDAMLDRIITDGLRFEYLSGGVTPIFQWHTTGWRVLPGLMCAQIYRGQDRILLAGNVEIPVPERSLMLLGAGCYHRVDLVAPEGLSRWAHVNFFASDHLDLFSLIDLPPVTPSNLGDAVGSAIAEWVAFEENNDARGLYFNARKNEFGFHLLGLLSQVCRTKPDATERVQQSRLLHSVIEYMHTHFGDAITRNDLAKLACLSPAQFHRIFHQVVGMTPVAYLRQVRMRQAQHQLLATSLSISEIAADVGYEDIFVFSKCFKRTCGVSPSEYRTTLRELRG